MILMFETVVDRSINKFASIYYFSLNRYNQHRNLQKMENLQMSHSRKQLRVYSNSTLSMLVCMLTCIALFLMCIARLSTNMLASAVLGERLQHDLSSYYEVPDTPRIAPEPSAAVPASSVISSNRPSDDLCTVPPFVFHTSSPKLESYMKLTEAEIYELATLVWLEAGIESYECQLAVASVVINRMTTSGQTLHEVIYAPHQFTPAYLISSSEPSESTMRATLEVLKNGPTLPEYVTFFRANYFFDWVEPYINIDHTYFSYDKSLANELGY